METHTHKRIYKELMRAKRPLFIADERIDGDSLGASLALVEYMASLGKSVPVFVSGSIPEKYKFLSHIDACTSDKTIFDDKEIDLVISFDCSDELYIASLMDLLPRRPLLINIDHHDTNSHFGDINQVVKDSPATAEVIYQFFRANNIVPSREAATSLLCGIAFDTTLFSNDATNPRTFDAASDLVLLGARVKDMIRMTFMNRSVHALRIWGIVLERLQTHPSMEFVSTYLSRMDIERHKITDEELDGLTNFLSLSMKQDTVFFIRETTDGGVKVSMRSSKKNVGALAKVFGGGGHKRAAGFTVPGSRLVVKKGRWQVVGV